MPESSPYPPIPDRTGVRLIGQSEALRSVESDIDCAARAGAKVLITGETGVGKEVVARLIHRRSPRSSRPLITMNCAGLPDGLVESELFGHERGSFTGAYRDKAGLLELAHTGTVFLDEVGEMSARMQVVLLRFLETGEIQRIGSDRVQRRVDVRLITATNRKLPKHIASGAFREDLYYRLNVIRIVIPPLRERPEDVPILLAHFLDEFGRQHSRPRPTIEAAALDVLAGYPWPGNVRELKNLAERLVLQAIGGTIGWRDLPEEIRGGAPADLPSATPPGQPTAGAQDVAPGSRLLVANLAARMLDTRESFWSVVYPPFMARDLTRADLRRIVEIGLESSLGSYRVLTRLFGMADEDYKRFLSFLKKHDCHVPYHRFRTPRSGSHSAERPAVVGE